MLQRLTITFMPEERRALQLMAEADVRPPREQIRWIVRQEAQRRGLLDERDDEQQPQHDGKGVRLG